MINNSVITLEDGNTYAVIEKIDSYIYLSNIKDSNDFCVRKQVTKGDENFLEGLDNKEEVDQAMKLFLEKHPVE
ncbi:MAG TPA: hypothetical protein IAB56_04185 [Candidatus Scybalousia intestinigallinarum]|nr:hypothetical protein [Candidatus Scybalousia intestinigallinarum]